MTSADQQVDLAQASLPEIRRDVPEYINVVVLRSLPESNPNRGADGSPKRCEAGGKIRGRMSSQSQKRELRESAQFQQHLEDDLENAGLGRRTRQIGSLLTWGDKDDLGPRREEFDLDTDSKERPLFASRLEMSDDVQQDRFGYVLEPKDIVPMTVAASLATRLYETGDVDDLKDRYERDIVDPLESLLDSDQDSDDDLWRFVMTSSIAEIKKAAPGFSADQSDDSHPWRTSQPTFISRSELIRIYDLIDAVVLASKKSSDERHLPLALERVGYEPDRYASECSDTIFERLMDEHGWSYEDDAESQKTKVGDYYGGLMKSGALDSSTCIQMLGDWIFSGPSSLDVALMGRMLTDNQSQSIMASLRVGHARTVHPIEISRDFFSVGEEASIEDRGAAHQGDTLYTDGALWREHMTVSIPELIHNLRATRLVDHMDVSDGAIAQIILTLLRTFATTIPDGHATGFDQGADFLGIVVSVSSMSIDCSSVDHAGLDPSIAIDQLVGAYGRAMTLAVGSDLRPTSATDRVTSVHLETNEAGHQTGWSSPDGTSPWGPVESMIESYYG